MSNSNASGYPRMDEMTEITICAADLDALADEGFLPSQAEAQRIWLVLVAKKTTEAQLVAISKAHCHLACSPVGVACPDTVRSSILDNNTQRAATAREGLLTLELSSELLPDSTVIRFRPRPVTNADDCETLTANISIQSDNVRVCILDCEGVGLEEYGLGREATIASLEAEFLPYWGYATFLTEDGGTVERTDRLETHSSLTFRVDMADELLSGTPLEQSFLRLMKAAVHSNQDCEAYGGGMSKVIEMLCPTASTPTPSKEAESDASCSIQNTKGEVLLRHLQEGYLRMFDVDTADMAKLEAVLRSAEAVQWAEVISPKTRGANKHDLFAVVGGHVMFAFHSE